MSLSFPTRRSSELLLRAIFGEKASDVRDTSLRLPPGVSGTIVEVRVFSRRGVDKDERALAIERAEIERLAKDRDDEKVILERSFYRSEEHTFELQSLMRISYAAFCLKQKQK